MSVGKLIDDAYTAAAEDWLAALPDAERQRWLDAAEADGRERCALSAYLLAGDIEAGDVQPPAILSLPASTRSAPRRAPRGRDEGR